MSRRKHRRFAVIAAMSVAAAALVTSPLWAGHLGRQIRWFEVQRVEVSGTRLLAPHEVLAASGVRQGNHLLDEADVWQTALLAHPVIDDVRLSRRPPHTLRIRISEKRPVALLADGTLRLVTAAGEVLPVDPNTVPLDLPIVHGSLADSATAVPMRRMLADVERLNDLAPAFMREVSEIRLHPGTPEAMALSHRTAEVLLAIGSPHTRLEELRLVLADADRRFPKREADHGTRRYHLDLRFPDQVVVRPSPSNERS